MHVAREGAAAGVEVEPAAPLQVPERPVVDEAPHGMALRARGSEGKEGQRPDEKLL